MSGSDNLISKNGGFPLAGVISATDPLLGTLGHYGGPTETVGLLAGSPAIGAGALAYGYNTDVYISTNKRGFAVNSPPDIGAFQAGPLVVESTAGNIDTEPADLTLAGAVSLANLIPGANTIIFDPNVFVNPQTITLTAGQLELTNVTGLQTVSGPAAGLTVSGGDTNRVFKIDAKVAASISGLTITGGEVSGIGYGGGVNNYGTANLTGCTVSGNSASVGGGGGVYDSVGGTMTLIDCTVSGNSATDGGGLGNDGKLTLIGCTVNGNSASYGGGLQNFANGTATLTNCTFSGNTANSDGGGRNNYGNATLTGCTVSGNSATYGGGGGLYNSGTTVLTDTIVAGNTNASGPNDIGGFSSVSGTYNLIGTGGAGGLTGGG